MSRDRALGALRYNSEFCGNTLKIHLDCTAMISVIFLAALGMLCCFAFFV